MNKLRLIFKLLFTRKRYILMLLHQKRDGYTLEVLTNVDADILGGIAANYMANQYKQERFEA